MSLYGRIKRNTTGYGVSGNVLGAYGHSATRPVTGVTKQHTGLPPKGSLSAHVPDPRKPGTLTVSMAKMHLDQIERSVSKPPERVNARTQGRAARFLKSATNLAGRALGMGRGPAPPAPTPEFARPDTPKVEAKTNMPRFGSKASAAERKQGEREKDAKDNGYVSSYNLRLHEAIDRHSAVEAQLKHAEGVHQSLIQSVGHARAAQAEATRAFKAAVKNWNTATDLVRETGTVLTDLEARFSKLEAKGRSIQSAMVACRARENELKAQKDGLPKAPEDGAVQRADSEYRNRVGELEQTKTSLKQAELTLAMTQGDLDNAKRKMRGTRSFSSELAKCRAAVIQCREVRNTARTEVERVKESLKSQETLVRESGERANALDAQKAMAARSGMIDKLLEEVAFERDAVIDMSLRHGLLHNACEAELPAAREAHEKANEAELKCRIDMEHARRAVSIQEERASGLAAEMDRVDPVVEVLAPNFVSATAELKALKDSETLRSREKIDAMIKSPPGFDRSQISPELQACMADLCKHLNAVPLNTEDPAQYRRDRIPDEQALEIVSRCLSLAIRDKPEKEAAVAPEEVLASLMNRSFADLVPHPGKSFSGREMRRGDSREVQSAVERFACYVAARPSGLELLMRIVRPEQEKPSRQLQDAVDVYFKATTALKPGNRPGDTDSCEWLEAAEQAAKLLAHPDLAPDDDNAKDTEDRKREQRIAFNGVRNGFMSVKEGSEYDKAKKALTKLSGDWMSRANQHAYKNSPLHARHMAAKASADVGLPTPETQLSRKLNILCDELLKRSGAELLAARTRVAQARQSRTEPPALPESLLKVHAVLQRIQQRAGAGDSLHSMTFGVRDWWAIRTGFKRLRAVEQAAPTKGGSGSRGKELLNQLGESVDQLRSNRGNAADGIGVTSDLGPQPSFSGLDETLSSIKFLRGQAKMSSFLADLARHLDVVGAAPPSTNDVPAVPRPGTRSPGQAQGVSRPAQVASNAPPGQAADQSSHPLDDDDMHFFDALETDQADDDMHFFDALQPDQADDDVPFDEWATDQAAHSLSDGDTLNIPSDTLALAVEQLFANLNIDPGAGGLAGALDQRLESLRASMAARGVAQPQTTLGKLVSEVNALQRLSDRFASTDGDFSAVELTEWLSQSVDGSFGRVSFNQGHQFSLGSNGTLGWSITSVTPLRPDVEVTLGSNYQLKAGRDALGIELSVGKQKFRAYSGAATASSAFAIGSSHWMYGPFASLSYSRTRTRDTRGVVLRNPKFDGKKHADLTVEFRETVTTLLKWQSIKNDSGGQIYEDPLEALLDRLPAISIATLESGETITKSSSSALGLFLGRAHSGIREREHYSGYGGVGGGALFTRSVDTRDFKTVGGSQGFIENSDTRLHTTRGDALAGYRGGYHDPGLGKGNLAGVRQTVGGLNGVLNWRRKLASAGYDIVRMPDGAIVADRFVEFTSYRKFEAAVEPHREKWIQAGIKATEWPDEYSESQKRSISQATFEQFMANAKESLKSGTVTLNETMDVTPEACAMLTASLALEELAGIEKWPSEDVAALRLAREKLLASESSYQPFLLKAIVRSNISHRRGVVFGLGGQTTKGAAAGHVFDWFPRVEKREIFKSLDTPSVTADGSADDAPTPTPTIPLGRSSSVSSSASMTSSASPVKATNGSSARQTARSSASWLAHRMKVPAADSANVGQQLSHVVRSSGDPLAPRHAPAFSSPGLMQDLDAKPRSTQSSVKPMNGASRTAGSATFPVSTGPSGGAGGVPKSPSEIFVPGFGMLTKEAVARDGDCLFHAAIRGAGELMARHMRCRVDELTPDRVRQHVAASMITVLTSTSADLMEHRDLYRGVFDIKDDKKETARPDHNDIERLRSALQDPELFEKAMGLTPNQLAHACQILRSGRYSGTTADAMPELLANAFPGLMMRVHDVPVTEDAGPIQTYSFFRAPAAADSAGFSGITCHVVRSGLHYEPAFPDPSRLAEI